MPGREDNAAPFSIVCLSSQEWRAPLPTNRQQIMRRAAARGFDVLFVETGDFLGKHLLALIRGPGRPSLARRLLVGEVVEPRVTVRKAINLLPWGQRYSVADRLNGRVNRLLFRRATRRLSRPTVAWLYDPRATWAIGAVSESATVYDCVDDYAEQTTHDRSRVLVARADREAAARSDLVFTTTRALYRRHRPSNAETHLVGNVGDFPHFAKAAQKSAIRSDLRGLPTPVMGFAGNVLSGKLDVGLLEDAADRYPSGTVLVAGPADDRLRPALESLAARTNVIWLGHVPYDELPSVVAAFDVALIPYESNVYTENVFPLKLFEYLAAGKPVVATGLPELAEMEPDVVVAQGRQELFDAMDAALRLTTPEDVRRRQRFAARHTWDTRTEELLRLTEERLRDVAGRPNHR